MHSEKVFSEILKLAPVKNDCFKPHQFGWFTPASNHFVEKAMAPTTVLMPGKSHGRRRLVGCSPWGHQGLDKTERLHFHFSLSCIGEGKGNPLQCSCLENPREPGGLLSMGSHRIRHD